MDVKCFFTVCDCDRLASVAPAAVCGIPCQGTEDECPDRRLQGLWEARKMDISNVKEHIMTILDPTGSPAFTLLIW